PTRRSSDLREKYGEHGAYQKRPWIIFTNGTITHYLKDTRLPQLSKILLADLLIHSKNGFRTISSTSDRSKSFISHWNLLVEIFVCAQYKATDRLDENVHGK